VTELDFVIVGTPRSGTTLVQRLANELDGVRLPPETHLLSLVAQDVLPRVSFPLDLPALTKLLDPFIAFHRADGLDVDAANIIERLGGTADSIFAVFAAAAAEMAGPGEVLGEKTPEHLLWWRPLTLAFPDLKVVAVVRDPRAVVASNLEVPFGMRWPDLITERWVWDQDEVVAAEAALGRDRCLVLRYEDIVEDAIAAREELGRFLNRPAQAAHHVGRAEHVAKEFWKEEVSGPITSDRADKWRASLPPAQAKSIAARARRHLNRFGYEPGSRRSLLAVVAAQAPMTVVRRRRFRAARRARVRLVATFAVTARRPPAGTPD
jgi:hypothetical protein